MIKAVIVDDEIISLKALSEKIKNNCSGIEVIKTFSKPQEAINEIPLLQPDVVFLDIEMPRINGFSLLKRLDPVSFEVIFTTAYNEYAIAALRISALDFLLKPIDVNELTEATERLAKKITAKHFSGDNNDLARQMQLFLQYQQQGIDTGKIALPVINGYEFVETSGILKIEAENVYSIFHFLDGKKITVSRTLKEIEDILCRSHFFRIHKSFIINLKCMVRYIKGEGGTVILSDGSEVPVSRRSKTSFINRIKT